jgi:hypothetical protein
MSERDLAMSKGKKVALRLMGVTAAWNVDAEPLHVEHAKLMPTMAQQRFRRYCPVCEKGVLLVRRDQKTLELLAEDNCMLCGQQFIYKDIKQMRKLDRGE